MVRVNGAGSVRVFVWSACVLLFAGGACSGDDEAPRGGGGTAGAGGTSSGGSTGRGGRGSFGGGSPGVGGSGPAGASGSFGVGGDVGGGVGTVGGVGGVGGMAGSGAFGRGGTGIRPDAGDGSAGSGSGDVCVPGTNDPPCIECTKRDCCDEYRACSRERECSAETICVQACVQQAVGEGGVADDATIGTCAAACAEGTTIRDTTNDLLACQINGSHPDGGSGPDCFVECLQGD